MRSMGFRLPLLAALVMGFGWPYAGAGEIVYLETADWVPTSSVLTVPTMTYLTSTSLLVPTSYVIPTAYTTAYATETATLVPTTYLAPTYYETRLRRGLFGRRQVETTRAYYMPTTAYYPTTYYYSYPTTYTTGVVDQAVVPTAYAVTTRTSSCCGTEVVASTLPTVRSLPVETAPAVTSTPPQSAAPAPRENRSPVIQSKPQEEELDSIPSTVAPAPATKPKAVPEQPAAAPAVNRESPPTPPAVNREKPTAAPVQSPPAQQPVAAQPKAGSASPAGAKPAPTAAPPAVLPAPGEIEPPQAPADGLDLRSSDEDKQDGLPPIRREVQKPSNYTARMMRPEFRNILFGNVKARTTGEPAEGVRVTLTSRTNAFEDRIQETDAAGRFAVRVPDGDWTVKVTMPSGRTYPVSQITVANGAITDDGGRDIPSLVITR